jgi:hypothetical protein
MISGLLASSTSHGKPEQLGNALHSANHQQIKISLFFIIFFRIMTNNEK